MMARNNFFMYNNMIFLLFRVSDILVRIRICGSVPGVPLFSSETFKTAIKKNFSSIFFVYFFEGTFTSFFKDKK